jgi:DNA-directed RNA polymerase subunit M/transcription elongation factor TFIIS
MPLPSTVKNVFPHLPKCPVEWFLSVCFFALDSDLGTATSHLFSLTKSLESEILKTTAVDPSSREPSSTYRPKIRSLFQNLKSNPSLRANLVAGHLSVKRLATMTSEEMASDKRKEENQKLQEKNIFNAQGAAPKNATTNEFQCGKCKQRKVSYYQMQTRSADEPMTSTPPFPKVSCGVLMVQLSVFVRIVGIGGNFEGEGCSCWITGLNRWKRSAFGDRFIYCRFCLLLFRSSAAVYLYILVPTSC